MRSAEETPAPAHCLLRATLDRDRALDWELVLAATGLSRQLESSGESADPRAPVAWRLFVLEQDLEPADLALRAYDQENAPLLARDEPGDYGDTNLGLFTAALLIVFQVRTGPRDAASDWFSRGSADAAAILSGEWWRAVTALTLHADLGHALGNAAAGALFLTLLARRIGPALAAWLVLGAAICGNLLTAFSARAHFVSVGASTGVFAALGALAVLQAASGASRRAWISLGAGVALLGFLGTGKEADLLAHLFGFLAGSLFGAAAAALVPHAPRRSLAQPLGAVLALAALGAAWFRALS